MLRAAGGKEAGHRRRRRGPTLAALLVAVACGPGAHPTPTPSLPTLPQTVLEGYSVRTEPLGAAAIAAEVADPGALTSVLDGMRSAVERRFSSRRQPEQLIIVRTLRFGSVSGAERVVTWMGANAAELLGTGAIRETVDVAGAVAFSRDPEGCCPGKEMVWWLVAWARGTDAFVVMVGGTRVRPGVVASLTTVLNEEATRA